MIQLNPYLTFNGNCSEAMTFYKSCFGGELTLQTVAETPMAAQCPAGMQDHIMHSMLAGKDFCLMATDMQSPDGVKPGNDMAIALNFDNEQAIRNCYSWFSEGGKIIDDLKDAPWGAMFGVVQDKFGKVWMMNFDTSEQS